MNATPAPRRILAGPPGQGAVQISAEEEVATLLPELIQIDTSNPGSGERAAAEWVAGKLDEVGIDCVIIEGSPGRASTIARISGTRSEEPALLFHGHLDVVPADPAEWTVHPFSGELRDGYVWGRGAVDMKNMNAIMLALVRDWARNELRPARDLVLAFVADEEAGGAYGARYLIERHGDLFADCADAIGEVGGFSMDISPKARLYFVQTAEKGINWLRLKASGKPGHASMLNSNNAVVELAAAVSRIGEHEFPIELTDTVRALLDQLSSVLGVDLDPAAPESWIGYFGNVARVIGASLRNTATLTMLTAGYGPNVVPSVAEAVIDARYLPGRDAELRETLKSLLGNSVDYEIMLDNIAVEAPFDAPIIDRMRQALIAEDPASHLLPYVWSGGTDAKSFARLGIRCFGFCPMRLPADLDFSALFHGPDERVPVAALRFAVRVLRRLLQD